MTDLQAGNPQATNAIAAKYLDTDLEPCCREYITSRITRYEKIINLAASHDFTDVFQLAIFLWNEKLFFEVHEYLEYHWMKSNGHDKKILQAMIRAAGTYVHLEQSNMKGAGKMAAKAVDALEEEREFVPSSLDLDLLLAKLRNLDPAPPKFMFSAKGRV